MPFAARCAEWRSFAAKNFQAVENDREKFTCFLAILFALQTRLASGKA